MANVTFCVVTNNGILQDPLYRNNLIKQELDKIIKSVTEIKFVTICLTKFFQKKTFLFREINEKLFLRAKYLLKGRRASGNENDYYLFDGK